MLRRSKKTRTRSTIVQRAERDTRASRARAEDDLLRADRKAAEAAVITAELRAHAERLEEIIFTLLGGES
jgi:hypothetical protein